MADRKLEQQIRTAVEHAVPDRLEDILSSCVHEQQTDHAFAAVDGGKKGATMEHKKSARGPVFAAVAAMAAMLVLCIGGYRLFQAGPAQSAASVILLDVNPSLSLSVDEEERVVSAQALNEDAQAVLGDMELENTPLDVAVNAIIGAMLQKGYLGDLQNSILVSVEDQDAAREETLQEKVTQAIVSAMQGGSLEAAVLSQSVDSGNAELAALAQEYQISLGKAALIQEVIAQAPELSFADLAGMTINEIALIASSRNLSGTMVTREGAASDKAYIGASEALNQACANAGVEASELLSSEVEFDSDGGVMLYEVEFETAARAYEYKIDAHTGEVLKFEAQERDGSAGGNSGYIGEAAAKQAALVHACVGESDTTWMHCRVEYDDGAPQCYEVEFAAGDTEYEYEIDLYTGAVLGYECETHRSDHHAQHHGSHHYSTADCIGGDAALTAALAHAGVARADAAETEVKLEEEDGTLIYKVEFHVGRVEYEYEIDAVSGMVLKAEQD